MKSTLLPLLGALLFLFVGCDDVGRSRFHDLSALECLEAKALLAHVSTQQAGWQWVSQTIDAKPAPKLAETLVNVLSDAVDKIPTPPPAPPPAKKPARGEKPEKAFGSPWDSAGPGRTLVQVRHHSTLCPAFERHKAWLLSLPDDLYDSLPVVFWWVIDDGSNCPTFYFEGQRTNNNPGGYWTITGWSDWREFNRQFSQVASVQRELSASAADPKPVEQPREQIASSPDSTVTPPVSNPVQPQKDPIIESSPQQVRPKGRKGRRIGYVPQSPGDPVSAISRSWIDSLFEFVGQGEVSLGPNAAIRIPPTVGFNLQRMGDSIEATLSDPLPLVRGKWGFFRYDDHLKGVTATRSGTEYKAAVKLQTVGEIPITVDTSK